MRAILRGSVLLLTSLAGAKPTQPLSTLSTNGSEHANHIFNSIHDSLKQLGSILHHNGMSFFIATVSEDSEFYHGTGSPYRINGTQWLAFEPEHAMAFAHPKRPRHGSAGKAEGNDIGRQRRKHHEQRLNAEDESQRYSPRNSQSDGRRKNHEPVRNIEHRKHDNAKSNDDTQDHTWQHHKDSDEDRHDYHRDLRQDAFHTSEEKELQSGHVDLRRSSHARKHKFHEKLEASRHDESREARSSPGTRDCQDDISRFKSWLPRFLRATAGFPYAGRHVNEKTPSGEINSPQHISQHVLNSVKDNDDAPEEPVYGYLHTYRTNRSLRLLYLDGQSAAKSLKGTLDTQDIVLRNATDPPNVAPIQGDSIRGDDLCSVAKNRWQSRIDGYIRMVGGFEIILCDFAKDLEVVDIMRVAAGESRGNTGSALDSYRAIAERYADAGGNRVSVDYDKFVSMYAFPEAIYFDDAGMPRVYNDSRKLVDVQSHLDDIVINGNIHANNNNWQNIADMIVARYSDRLEYLTSGAIENIFDLKPYIESIMAPFIDAGDRNRTEEAKRCAKQLWPSHSPHPESVPAQAVSGVLQRLCGDLNHAAALRDFDEAMHIIHMLKKWLGWASFKKCRCSSVQEVCRLPVWPSASEEDFHHPKCTDRVSHGEGGYWDMMGRRRD